MKVIGWFGVDGIRAQCLNCGMYIKYTQSASNFVPEHKKDTTSNFIGSVTDNHHLGAGT
jgi:hypothetical protein